jgi:endo-1,4-beta-xylanase
MLVLSFLVCLSGLSVEKTQAQTICANGTGTHDGYKYELWNSGTTEDACMTLKAGGAFSCEWNDFYDVMFRKGLNFDRTPYPEVGNIIVKYGAKFQPGLNSYLAVYGRFDHPLAEYYIVESWGEWRPPGSSSVGASLIGTFRVDDGTYEIYKAYRPSPVVIGPGISIEQYWSIRTSKRTNGTISVSKHFDKWASLDLPLGELYDVSLLVEGYESNGQADVYYMSIGVFPPFNLPEEK